MCRAGPAEVVLEILVAVHAGSDLDFDERQVDSSPISFSEAVGRGLDPRDVADKDDRQSREDFVAHEGDVHVSLREL
tara:strand:- start:3656 stop:3886 length:231 start_codon:yes stop_codon:yes gene_type:complete